MRLNTGLAALAVFAASSLTVNATVVDVDQAQLDQLKADGTPVFLKLFTTWCSFCKRLAEPYEELAQSFSGKNIRIAQIDCEGPARDVCQSMGVQGYPTLKLLKGDEVIDYNEGRDLESMSAFITEQTGVKSKTKAAPPSAMTQLDAANFHAHVAKHDTLVMMAAPWCGHCVSARPILEKVAQAFSSEACDVAYIDADQHKDIASEFGVRSFPTIKMFKDGQVEDYQGARTEQAFVEFLNSRCGTHRSPSGGLLPSAGRIAALDDLAARFYSEVPSRAAVLAQARSIANASYYLTAMERIESKGEAWVAKEAARIAKLLGSPSLAPSKKDELQIRANVLSTFVKRKFDQAYDAASAAGASVTSAANAAKNSAHSLADAVADAATDLPLSAHSLADKAAQATDRVKEEL